MYGWAPLEVAVGGRFCFSPTFSKAPFALCLIARQPAPVRRQRSTALSLTMAIFSLYWPCKRPEAMATPASTLRTSSRTSRPCKCSVRVSSLVSGQCVVLCLWQI